MLDRFSNIRGFRRLRVPLLGAALTVGGLLLLPSEARWTAGAGLLAAGSLLGAAAHLQKKDSQPAPGPSLESSQRGDLHAAMERLYREKQSLTDQMDELAAVREVSLAVGSILDFNEMIKAILDLVTSHFSVNKALIYLRTGDEDILEIVGARADGRDISPSRVLQKRIKLGAGMVGRAASERQEVIEQRDGKGAVAAVPLVTKSRVVGVMKLFDPDQGALTPERCKRLRAVAGAIAVALENSRLYRMAVTDGLTGLYVHRHFQQRLEEEFIRSIRYASPLALLMVDIDHFKKINDSYGHQGGDTILRGVAAILREEARGSDIACRYGGEEMAVICPETDLSGALQIAERIRTRIEKFPFRVETSETEVQVTASIGVAETARGMKKRSEIIEAADSALYRAKHNGRNCVEAAATIATSNEGAA